jgi:hypothetical protein
MYTVSCHNEFCNGPEHFANIDVIPEGGIKCPVCGWLALLGSGIKKIREKKEEVENDSK